ncbi:MAG: PAS domain-containing sensor histidine kinase [Gemmatimonadota bacterium]
MAKLTPGASGPRRRPREPLKFAFYYAAFGVTWVLGTDLLAEWIAQDEAGLRRLSTLKGWLFVLISTGFVYVLALKSVRSQERATRTARDAEHRFRGLMEHAPDMVFWVAEGFGRVRYISSTLERLWGCAPERVYDDPDVLLAFIHPDDREQFLAGRRAVRDGSSFDREYRIVRSDGEIRWMRSQGYPIYDEAIGVEGVAGVTQDITRQKALIEELRRSEEQHRRAQRIGGIGHWVLDPETRELEWSDEVYRIFGLEPGVFVPTPESFHDRVHPEDRAAQAAADEWALAGVAPLDMEHRIIRPDGEIRHVHERATLVEDAEGTQRLVGTVQDVTERRLLQKEVEASRDMLRRYLANKIGEREREKISLAREIHDQLGQLLTVVRLQLGRELRHAAGERHARLAETLAVVDSALEEMRSIASRLRPPALDHLGLVQALEDFVVEFSEGSGLRTSFSSDFEQVALDGEVSGHLFRIVQEALTNVARHARADAARVELRSENDTLVLRVLDDGIGLSSRSPPPDRLGIVGMRERALLLGGSFELLERGPRGLEVRVAVPYSDLSPSA